MRSLKNMKFPLVNRKKLEIQMENNKVINNERKRLTEKNKILEAKLIDKQKVIDEKNRYIENITKEFKDTYADNIKLSKSIKRLFKNTVLTQCKKCGKFYKITTIPTKYYNLCDKCMKGEKK